MLLGKGCFYQSWESGSQALAIESNRHQVSPESPSGRLWKGFFSKAWTQHRALPPHYQQQELSKRRSGADNASYVRKVPKQSKAKQKRVVLGRVNIVLTSFWSQLWPPPSHSLPPRQFSLEWNSSLDLKPNKIQEHFSSKGGLWRSRPTCMKLIFTVANHIWFKKLTMALTCHLIQWMARGAAYAIQ